VPTTIGLRSLTVARHCAAVHRSRIHWPTSRRHCSSRNAKTIGGPSARRKWKLAGKHVLRMLDKAGNGQQDGTGVIRCAISRRTVKLIERSRIFLETIYCHNFCRAMLCISTAYAAMRCLRVRVSGSHTILV